MNRKSHKQSYRLLHSVLSDTEPDVNQLKPQHTSLAIHVKDTMKPEVEDWIERKVSIVSGEISSLH